VGTFAVQLAKHFGAHVTVVDTAAKSDLLRSLGADEFIDYTQQDYAASGQQYDRILDVVAYRSVFAHRRALSPNGVFVYVGGSTSAVFQGLLLAPLLSRFGSQTLGVGMWEPNKEEDLAFLGQLFEAGKVAPVIDKHYPLEETAEAFRYVQAGRQLGKVVITVQEAPSD
jgi:NADPH:quinone reductase-like Zn-dependent oxidoreductase